MKRKIACTTTTAIESRDVFRHEELTHVIADAVAELRRSMSSLVWTFLPLISRAKVKYARLRTPLMSCLSNCCCTHLLSNVLSIVVFSIADKPEAFRTMRGNRRKRPSAISAARLAYESDEGGCIHMFSRMR